MASISSASSIDHSRYEPDHDTPAPRATPAAASGAAAAPLALVTRRAFHRDIDAPTTHHPAPRGLHGYALREGTLANVAALFKGADDMSAVGAAQDQALANTMCRISRIALPDTVKANDGVVLPPDLMAYWVRHGDQALLQYTCPELNGTGFGGIATMAPKQFHQMMLSHDDVARQIRSDAARLGEQPLVLVPNSGREGSRRSAGAYPAAANSKMIWEKAHVAERYALALSKNGAEVFADSLDRLVTPYYQALDAAAERHGKDTPAYAAAEREARAGACAAMAEHAGKPLVLLGYSLNVAELCEVKDGRAFLFGRPVHGLVNDRAAENLCMVKSSRLDFTRMALINSTVSEGVNKFEAALARAEFSASPQAAALPALAAERGFSYDVQGLDKAFHYTDPDQRGDTAGMTPLQLKAHYATFFRGVDSEQQVGRAFDDFAALGEGLRPLFKPNGTGQSKGIIGVRDGERKEDFMQRFRDNLNELERDFGAGAGYPFQVEVLKELDRTAEGENYDLRYTILQGRQPHIGKDGLPTGKKERVIEAFPLLYKKEPAPDAARGGPIEFAPTNVTAAVARTGRPASDFVVPLCTRAGLEGAGLNDGLAKSISLYFAALYAFVLETRYARTPAPRPKVGKGRILPFPARTTLGEVQRTHARDQRGAT